MMQDETIKKINFKKKQQKKRIRFDRKKIQEGLNCKKKKTILKTNQIKQIVIKKQNFFFKKLNLTKTKKNLGN